MDYVLDFVCLEKHLVIEVDGGQHLDCERDNVRDQRLREAGFRILRFWNNQVLQEIDAVTALILTTIDEEDAEAASPTPHPSPAKPNSF